MILLYGLISNHKIRVKNFDFSETKAGEKLTEDITAAKKLFGEAECVTEYEIKSYAKKEIIPKKLSSRIGKMEVGDIILMPWLPKLPTEAIVQIFQETYDKGIGIAIFDGNKLSNFSTIDENMNLVNKEKFHEIIESITELTIKGSNGRKKASDIPEHFGEIYWQFENYFISREEAYDNKYFKCGNSKWNRLCSLYESTPEYKEEQLNQEKLYKISETPKRSFCSYLSPDEVEVAYQNNKITEIDKTRMLLKLSGGKKEMFKLSSRYNKKDA